MSKKNLIIILGLALLAFIIVWLFNRTDSETIETGGEVISKACLNAREDLTKALDDMNYCETAGDCVLLNGCPYGCNNLIHKDAEWDELVKVTEVLSAECPVCTETCGGALRSGEIDCVEGKCVGNR